jgi:hypothetical protein
MTATTIINVIFGKHAQSTRLGNRELCHAEFVPFYRSRSEYNDQHRDRLTESITFVLTAEQAKLGPRVSKLMRLNNDVDRLFKDHLIEWILAKRDDGISVHPACKMFLKRYNIDENEYSLDAAYRFWQRVKGENSKEASTSSY